MTKTNRLGSCLLFGALLGCEEGESGHPAPQGQGLFPCSSAEVRRALPDPSSGSLFRLVIEGGDGATNFAGKKVGRVLAAGRAGNILFATSYARGSIYEMSLVPARVIRVADILYTWTDGAT